MTRTDAFPTSLKLTTTVTVSAKCKTSWTGWWMSGVQWLMSQIANTEVSGLIVGIERHYMIYFTQSLPLWTLQIYRCCPPVFVSRLVQLACLSSFFTPCCRQKNIQTCKFVHLCSPVCMCMHVYLFVPLLNLSLQCILFFVCIAV